MRISKITALVLTVAVLVGGLLTIMTNKKPGKPAKEDTQITRPTKKELERVNKEKPKLKRNMPRAYA